MLYIIYNIIAIKFPFRESFTKIKLTKAAYQNNRINSDYIIKKQIPEIKQYKYKQYDSIK